MKGTIIYKSTYGSTKEYAAWLAEETGFALVNSKNAATEDIAVSDTVIIGCWILKNEPVLKKWILKNWELLSKRNVILFTTSGASPSDPLLRRGYIESFPDEVRVQMQYFPLGGRMDFENLSRKHKFFMKIGQKLEKDPKVKEEMVKNKDNVDKKLIQPILDYIEGL